MVNLQTICIVMLLGGLSVIYAGDTNQKKKKNNHSVAEPKKSSEAITKIGKLKYTTCALGLTLISGECEGEVTEFGLDAIQGKDNVCSQLTLGGHRWRLPTYNELLKIKGTIIARNAPLSSNGFFWSSTQQVSGNEDVWKILDYNSFKPRSTFVESGYVICVAE